MDGNTLNALHGSIAKWTSIVEGSGIDRGTKNCSLCILFHADHGHPFGCRGCPVREKTGVPNCLATPYPDYHRARKNGRAHDEERAARAMLDYLNSLLPAEALPTNREVA